MSEQDCSASTFLSFALLTVAIAISGCVETADITPSTETSASTLTPEECMESSENGRVGVCHETSGSPPYVLINIAEQACVNAHSSQHSGDFLATDGDCSCVGDGQACQESAPCCSGNCDGEMCAPACSSNGSACEADAECCIGICTEGTCCKGFRGKCTTGAECCSGRCVMGGTVGTCASSP